MHQHWLLATKKVRCRCTRHMALLWLMILGYKWKNRNWNWKYRMGLACDTEDDVGPVATISSRIDHICPSCDHGVIGVSP